MAVYLSKEKKAEIFQEYSGDANNTGSAEGQIALFTFRIKCLSEHLKENKKDHSCRRALLGLVGQRRKMLSYLAKKDVAKYRQLLETLNIRK